MTRRHFDTRTNVIHGRGVTTVATLAVAISAGWPQQVSALLMDEIIITAERREASIQETPIAISAFSEEQMDAFGVTSGKELQNITPALIVTNIGTTTSQFLRGIGTRLAAPGFEPSVATYIDDRYIARDLQTNVNMVDLERVEVLKGPQGTFFGRNASGGAIRFITRNPTDELEGMINVNIGSYDYRQFSGVFNTPLGENASIRLVAQKIDRDYFFDNIYEAPGVPSGIDDEDNLTLRAKLNWDITERINLLFSQSYYEKEDTRGQGLVDRSPPGLSLHTLPVGPGITSNSADEVALNWIAPSKLEDWASQAVLTVSFDSFDFVSTTVYTDTKESLSILDADGTNLRALDIAGVYRPNDSFSQELRLQSNNDNKFSWLVGLYYFEEDAEHEGTFDVGFPFLLSQGHDFVNTESQAIFGQIEWAFNPDWTLILGGRYTKEEKSNTIIASSRPGVGLTLTGPLPYSGSEDWNEFTPRATLQYRFGEQMVYATYARGFKSGGLNYPHLSAGVPQPVLDPEILDMYELGAKGSAFDNRLRFDASLFYYDFQDLQVVRSLGGTSTVTENAANAEVLGLDLNLDWLVTDNWLLTLGINVLDNEYQDYIAAARTFDGTPGTFSFPYDADGHELLRAPDHSYTLSSRYMFNLADATVPIVVSYSYKGEYYFDFVTLSQTNLEPLAQSKENGYGLLSASISYVPNSEKLKVRLWGKNLTDEEYFNDTTTVDQGMKGGYADPRTYGIEIQFNF